MAQVPESTKTAERTPFERFYAVLIEAMIGVVFVLICASFVNVLRHESLKAVLFAGRDVFAVLGVILFINGLLRRFYKNNAQVAIDRHLVAFPAIESRQCKNYSPGQK